MVRFLKSFALSVVAGLLLYWGLMPRNGVTRDYGRAIAAWHANPTEQTLAELERQKRTKAIHEWMGRFVFFGGLLTVAIAAAHTWCPRLFRPTRSTHDTSNA